MTAQTPTGTTSRLPVSLLLFTAIATAVYAIEIVMAGLLPRLARPNPVAVGMTLDMVVVVPIAFYFLVVRRQRLPIVALIPVVVLSLVAAARVLPAEHRGLMRIFELSIVPLELAVLGWIGWRATRAMSAARRDATADPPERLHRAALALLHKELAAGIIASEMSVFYYAFAWRARPHTLPDARAFTHHERSAQASLVLGAFLIIVVEGLGVHFLLARWSLPAAWVFTATSAYTLLWLIADYRASVRRPILVGADTIRFRAGLRWTLQVPREQVVQVSREKPAFAKQCLKLTFLTAPTHWVTFREPVEAVGLYGWRRRVRAVGLEPDDVEAFENAMVPPATNRTA